MSENNEQQAWEVNFDGLVGLSHNFAGLSVGNVASENNAGAASQPKKAALQGLKKMKALHDLGLKQGIIAPQERPNIYALRRLGFNGTDEAVLAQVTKDHSHLLYSVSSASSMWTANACTTSPSVDTANKKVHFTPANLSNKYHRSIEWPCTAKILKAIFSSDDHFCHHSALPSVVHFGDEGAANHTRFCHSYGQPGLELFIYGKSAFHQNAEKPQKFPARQTQEACQMIARLHGLDDDKTIIGQQHPKAIDAGVFHNDVIAVGNKNVLFFHEYAFLHEAEILEKINHHLKGELIAIKVSEAEVPLQVAVSSYLFNSQLVSLPSGEMALVAPSQCKDDHQVKTYLDTLLEGDGPIKKIIYFNLKQSMKNGGGPACLRQRVVLTNEELQQVNPSCLLDDNKYDELYAWVNKHYRDRLVLDDLQDPNFLYETRTALDELTKILDLGNIYQFQF